jgi:hypothetical protein
MGNAEEVGDYLNTIMQGDIAGHDPLRQAVKHDHRKRD